MSKGHDKAAAGGCEDESHRCETELAAKQAKAATMGEEGQRTKLAKPAKAV
jgi:hypothetical protein